MTPCPYCNNKADLVAENPDKHTYHCKICRNFFEIFPAPEKIKTKLFDSKESGLFPRVISQEGTRDIIKETSLEPEGQKRQTQRERVLNYLRTHQDACLRQIGEELGIEKSTVCLRLAELKKANLAGKNGFKVYKNHRVETWKIH